MIVNEGILITILIYTCIYVTITDMKKGLVQNNVLMYAGISGLIANTVYYSAFARPLAIAFAVNWCVMTAISILFYALHIWAAGDSKLLSLSVFLIPARIYYRGNTIVASVTIMIIIFSAAYLYIIAESVYLGIKNKNFFKINKFRANILPMIKQYIKCTCLATIFTIIFKKIAPDFYADNMELMMLLNMAVIMLSYGVRLFDKVWAMIGLVFVTIIVYIFIGIPVWGGFTVDLRIYILTLAVLVPRLFAEKYNYRTIAANDVEKGMVLAYTTVVKLIPSKVRGLPKNKATEDIRSRITAEEAASIKKWENSKYGCHEITIVRKIPFAIFISIGAVVYVLAKVVLG